MNFFSIKKRHFCKHNCSQLTFLTFGLSFLKAYHQKENIKREIYTLIGSSKVTGNIDLLKCLEQKFDFIIIERDYHKILKGEQRTPSKLCLQPDLMLDHNTGVIIENIVNFTNEEGYKNAVDLVLSTSFKCQMCSIILLCDTDGITP